MAELLRVRAVDGAASATASSITPVVGTNVIQNGDGTLGWLVNTAQTKFFVGSTGSAKCDSNQVFSSADYRLTAINAQYLPGINLALALQVRAAGTDYYMMHIYSTTGLIHLYTYVGGTFTDWGVVAFDWSDTVPRTIAIECSGQVLKAFVSGTEVLSATVSGLTAPGKGIWETYTPSGVPDQTNGFQFTDMVVSDLVAPPSVSFYTRHLLRAEN